MQSTTRTLGHPAVIAGVDGSAAAPAVLRYAAADAARHGLPLRVVHVVAPFGGDDLTTGRPLVDQAALGLMRRQVRELGRVRPGVRRTPTSFSLRHGSPIGELVAESEPGSRLVVAADRSGSGRARGVVAGGLAARVECPVTVLPREHLGDEPAGRVVVGYKDRWESTAALDAGFDEAARRRLRLLVVHAPWQDVSAAEADELRHLDELIAARSRSVPELEVQMQMANCDFSTAVSELVMPGDLLVIGRSNAWTTHPSLGPGGSGVLLDPASPVLVAPAVLALHPGLAASQLVATRGTA